MAVKNRGLRPSLGGFYDQYDVEIIQRDTASWYPDKPLFSDWVSVFDVEDTGERSGLSESSWGSHGSGNVAKEDPPNRDLPADILGEDILGGEDIVGGEETVVDSTVPLPKLTRTAKQYASMMQTGIPILPVHTGVEKRKFASELADNYFQPGDPRGRLQRFQRINFDKWAAAWNDYCTKIESGVFDWEPVYRKTSKDLEKYFDLYKQRANTTLTMMPIQRGQEELRKYLQEAETGKEFDYLVGDVVPTPAPPQKGSGSGVGAVQEGGFAGGGGGGILSNSSDDEEMIDVGSVEGGPVENPAGLSVTAPQQKSKQRPQTCHECGHRKQEGEYQALHRHARIAGAGKSQCQVPVEERRDSVFRTGRKAGGRKIGEESLRRFDVCACAKCKPVLPVTDV